MKLLFKTKKHQESKKASSRTASKNTLNVKSYSTIRFKLIAAFLVPIAFIIILGIVSSEKAASGLRSSYEASTSQSVGLISAYFTDGLGGVEDTSVNYDHDNNIVKYFLGVFKNDQAENFNQMVQIRDLLNSKYLSDKFIKNIYILSDKVAPVSTSGKNLKGAYGEFLKTDQGKYLLEHTDDSLWLGNNATTDKLLDVNNKVYSVRLIRNLSTADAIIIFDIKSSVVEDMLHNLKLDKSAIMGFVTVDGKEIYDSNHTDLKSVFSGKDFYKNAQKSTKVSGSEYVTYQGKECLFTYSKVGKTGTMVCVLVPKATILKQADSIKFLTAILVIIACLVAIFIGAKISSGMDKTIRKMISSLRVASQGDLTVDFSVKRKDEFGILAYEIQNTFDNMKVLIQQVNSLSTQVSASSSSVSGTSEAFMKTTQNISQAMDEIEQGVMQQAKDAEQCLLHMDELSKRIQVVSDNTDKIGEIAEQTRHTIQEGTVTTNDLNEQTRSTIAITTEIIDVIETLFEKSLTISRIISVINDIADQTGLLSLNASIEAARAGEQGKGFAVVANEIRSLAEQSQNSVNDINTIIRDIQSGTNDAVQIAKKAENVMTQQESVVKNTTESYQNINDRVEKLVVYLKHIAENVENIEAARAKSLGAVESISAVLEEIAASSNSVNQISSEQVESVEELNVAAGSLKENADVLVQSVQKFSI
jgi:Methyl-accepting chemotaxis protein